MEDLEEEVEESLDPDKDSGDDEEIDPAVEEADTAIIEQVMGELDNSIINDLTCEEINLRRFSVLKVRGPNLLVIVF